MKQIFRIGIITLLGAMMVQAAETRIWTSRKGSNLEAQLLNVEGEKVTLLTPESRELELKIEDLSLADRQYLVEYGGADPKIVASGELGAPELEVKIDSKTFKKLDETLKLGEHSEALTFELLETEHFLIASDGIRQQPIAETAERMWHGMAFEHMNFRKDWGDRRMLVLMVEDRENFTALGNWYRASLEARGVSDDVIKRSKATWEEVGATGLSLTDELISEYKLHDRATVFNIREDRAYKKDMSSFPVHVIAGALLGKQMGGVSDYGSDGYFSVVTGFAYFKEIKLTKKTETSQIDAAGSQFDEITKSRGFEDGTSWAKTLRKLVKKGDVEPNFDALLSWKSQDLDPEKLVLIYSFAHYCNSTPDRLAGFAKMVRRVETSDQIPEAIEFARLMGFESVEDLQKDWTEFVSSTAFK
ncbi:MAG: hypothetical protein AAGI48_06885 [Verrucomicrobiota bacterium]